MDEFFEKTCTMSDDEILYLVFFRMKERVQKLLDVYSKENMLLANDLLALCNAIERVKSRID